MLKSTGCVLRFAGSFSDEFKFHMVELASRPYASIAQLARSIK